MIWVCNVVSVSYTGNDAKSLLKLLCKFISCWLKRSTVNTVINIFLFLPLVTRIIHILHNWKSKRLTAIRISMWLARHILCTFIKTCIAKWNGWITVKEQSVNGFTLFESCKCTVLPQNRCSITHCAHKSVMTALECPVAKVKTLIKYLPELGHITARWAGDVNKVKCYNTLIETTVIFLFTFNIVLGIRNISNPVFSKSVRCKEWTAAHTGVNITL